MKTEHKLSLAKQTLAFKLLLVSLVASLLLTLVGTAPAPVSAQQIDAGNDRLAQIANIYLRGDVVASGVGLRGSGSGTINLSGIPAGASVYRAYLYWATLGSVNTYTEPLLNGSPVAGAWIGTTADTCWNVQHNYVYRADVTGLVTGNGDYTISGLPNDLYGNGNDSQGASLVVIYYDPTAPYRTIIINDGAVALDEFINSYTDTISGYTASESGVEATITYLVGDGQYLYEDGEEFYVSGDVTFNGQWIGSDLFEGAEGDYWDTYSQDVSSLVGEAPASTTVNNDSADSFDCLLWAATIFSVTSPPAEGSTNELTWFDSLTLHGDITAAGVGLRGTGQGTISMSGIPVGAYVRRAYLYWATLGNSSQFDSPSLNGMPVDGEHIATSADTCWGVANNYVYRADVTAYVSGNGSYQISGLPADLLGSGNDSQGASLVVVYSGLHYLGYLYRTVVIHDGAVTLDLNVHTYTDQISAFSLENSPSEARVTYLIGDGQSIWDNGDVLFNGTSIASNVFTGVDGDHWGTLAFDVTSEVSGSPVQTTIDNEDPDNEDASDCLLWAATLFSVTKTQPVYDHFIHIPLVTH